MIHNTTGIAGNSLPVLLHTLFRTCLPIFLVLNQCSNSSVLQPPLHPQVNLIRRCIVLKQEDYTFIQLTKCTKTTGCTINEEENLRTLAETLNKQKQQR